MVMEGAYPTVWRHLLRLHTQKNENGHGVGVAYMYCVGLGTYGRPDVKARRRTKELR